jgi:hypothetical protein
MLHKIGRRTILAGLASSILVPLGSLPMSFRAAAQDRDTDPAELVGVWRGTESIGRVIINGEVIFYEDGGYRRMHQLGYLETWDVGSYRIARNWIHFEIEDYEPKYYQGVFQHRPPSDTWKVLRLRDGVMEGRIGDAARFHYEKD